MSFKEHQGSERTDGTNNSANSEKLKSRKRVKFSETTFEYDEHN